MIQDAVCPLLLGAGPTLAVMAMVVAFHWGTGVSVRTFTSDAAALYHAPFYASAVSNLGFLLWASTAAVCLASGSLLKTTTDARFLRFGAVLSCMLLVDDLFLIHESVAPTFLHIPEKAVYLCHAVAAMTFLFVYRHRILTTRFLVLGCALAMFAASLGIDVLSKADTYLLEDGTKFVGIGCWASYFIWTTRDLIRSERAQELLAVLQLDIAIREQIIASLGTESRITLDHQIPQTVPRKHANL